MSMVIKYYEKLLERWLIKFFYKLTMSYKRLPFWNGDQIWHTLCSPNHISQLRDKFHRIRYVQANKHLPYKLLPFWNGAKNRNGARPELLMGR